MQLYNRRIGSNKETTLWESVHSAVTYI